MFAGYIELLADDPVASEQYLRIAYNGLVDLGAEADAGRAAAHLACSLFAQGRIDEAAEIADASEALAGQNLRTLISSRAVRAEIAATRGDGAGARQLATEAVEIAELTDLTIDHADAARTLGVVLRSVGDDAAAIVAERTARDLYNAKGASVVSGHTEPPFAGSERAAPNLTNSAARNGERFWYTVYHDLDLDAAFLMLSEDLVSTDHRRMIGSPDLTKSGVREFLELFIAGRTSEIVHTLEVLAVRGDNFALMRLDLMEGDTGWSQSLLQLHAMGADGLACRSISYSPEDVDSALQELDELHAASLLDAPDF
jgi:hypothetical protein